MLNQMFFSLLFFSLTILRGDADEASIVSCGSVVKLKHKETGHHLHSHQIAWGSGSGQQSVTGHGSNNDPGAMWVVKEGHNGEVCEAGTIVECGKKIRFEHAQTGKNLHSHLFTSPISNQQEVSAYGDNGQGDTGDNWEVICDAGKKHWTRGDAVQFKHSDTGKFLITSAGHKFNQGNCGPGCPIMGQTEVSCGSTRDVSKLKWLAGQGVYFPAADPHAGKNEL